jgi:hypothetical protein
MNRKTKTQKETILGFLATGRNLSRARAESWGVQRLSARIFELREQGYTIYTNNVKLKKTGKVVKAYRLYNPDNMFNL